MRSLCWIRSVDGLDRVRARRRRSLEVELVAVVGWLGRSERGRLARDARFGWGKCEAGRKQAKLMGVTGSQRAERSQCKKCSVITSTKTAQTKKKLPPEQIVQDVELGGCQAAGMAAELGRVGGLVELLFIGGSVWILAMMLPWCCCQEEPSKGVVVRRQEQELWTTTRVLKNNVGPGGGWNRRKTQENDKEEREKWTKDKRGGDEGKGVPPRKKTGRGCLHSVLSCRVVLCCTEGGGRKSARGEKEARSQGP